MRMIFAFIILFTIICGNVNAQEWIAVRTTPPIPEINNLPPVCYPNHIIVQIPRPVVYQLVPYIIQQPILVEQKYTLFCKRYIWTTQPQVQWVYQLSYVNQ
jgi:hypothetical protein